MAAAEPWWQREPWHHSEKVHLIEPWWGTWVGLAYALLVASYYSVIRGAFSFLPVRHILRTRRDRAIVRDQLVSATSAAIIFALAVRSKLAALPCLAAYLIFDLALSLDGRMSLEMIGHHLLGISVFGIALWARVGVRHAINAALVEGSTVFLNLSKVLRKLGRERTRACRLCDSATIVSFAVIRLGVQPFCFYRLWVDDSLPAAVWLIGVVGNTALIVLNCVWFRALLRAAARPSKHV